MQTETRDQIDATGLRIGLAVSQYHREITESMQHAAIQAFTSAGGRAEDVLILPAAGAFELTAVVRALALLETRTGRPALDAVIAIGCIITGQTTHDQHLANSVTHGLTAITVQTGIPVAFGILTCQSVEQARQRSIDADKHGARNKGTEAMLAAVHTARTLRSLQSLRGWR